MQVIFFYERASLFPKGENRLRYSEDITTVYSLGLRSQFQPTVAQTVHK